MNKIILRNRNYNGANSKCFSLINSIKRQLRRGIIIITALYQSSYDLANIKNWLILSGCSRKQVNDLKIYWADNSRSVDEIKTIFKKHPNASVIVNNKYGDLFNNEIKSRNAFALYCGEDNYRNKEDDFCWQNSIYPINREDTYRLTIYECHNGIHNYDYLEAEMIRRD